METLQKENASAEKADVIDFHKARPSILREVLSLATRTSMLMLETYNFSTSPTADISDP